MKNKLLFTSLSALALAFWVAQSSAAPASGPKPGLRVVDPPGQWQETLILGQPGATGNEIKAGNEYYEFSGAKITDVQPSADPNWDWVTVYEGGTLKLKNVPGAPWYTKRDPEGKVYEFTNITVVNHTRSTRYNGTELEGQLDFELTGYTAEGDAIMFGAYSGVPDVAPDSAGAVASGTLDSAVVKAPPPTKK